MTSVILGAVCRFIAARHLARAEYWRAKADRFDPCGGGPDDPQARADRLRVRARAHLRAFERDVKAANALEPSPKPWFSPSSAGGPPPGPAAEAPAREPPGESRRGPGDPLSAQAYIDRLRGMARTLKRITTGGGL